MHGQRRTFPKTDAPILSYGFSPSAAPCGPLGYVHRFVGSYPDSRSVVMRVKVTSLVLLVAASAVVAGQQNSYVGRWNITGTGPDTDKVYFLEVKQNGDQLEGLFLDRVAHATPVSWIRVENGELAWQYGGGGETLPKPACGPVYRARLENGK